MSTVNFRRPFSPFVAAREDYLLAIELEGRSPRTVEKYRRAIDRFGGLMGEPDPAAVDAATLRRFLKALADAGRATSTRATYLVAVKTWLAWLADEGGYGVDLRAIARVKGPRVVRDPIVPFTEAECARLLAAGKPGSFRGHRLRAIVATLLDTGVRQGELLGLRLGDLDLEAGEIRIRPETDKTRKGRTIALGKRARLELSRYWSRHRYREPFDLSPDSALFVKHDGGGITRTGLQLMLIRLGARANVPHVHPHRFRHTFAILSLRAGMDPYVLQASLGHRDMAMTARYVHLTNQDVREAKRAKSPLDRLKGI